jgi:hypothetical protein
LSDSERIKDEHYVLTFDFKEAAEEVDVLLAVSKRAVT